MILSFDMPFDDEYLKAFTIDPESIPDPSSKDELKAIYEGLTSMFESNDIKAHTYRIENLAKLSSYSTKIWINSTGDFVGSCNCLARKICKHVLMAARLTRTAIQTGFIK